MVTPADRRPPTAPRSFFPLPHGGRAEAAARLLGRPIEAILDFSANLNPFGPPPEVRRALASLDGEIARYPDPPQSPFARSLAEALALPPESVLPGSGCTEFIFLVPRALKAERVHVPIPSYPDYRRAAALAGRRALPFRVSLDGTIPWERIWTRRLRGPGLVFLGNPDNPTGRKIEADRIRRWARRRPAVLWAVDESFVDLLPSPGPFSLLRKRFPPNVLVLGSLTKAYAIPGLRLWYAAGSSPLIARLRAAQEPWTVNGLALRAGEACLAAARRGFLEDSRRAIAREGRRLFDALAALPGLRPRPPSANFLLVEGAGPGLGAAQIGSRLLDRGVLVRDAANFGGLGPRFFRAAVRGRAENARFVEALRAALASAPGGAPQGGRREGGPR